MIFHVYRVAIRRCDYDPQSQLVAEETLKNCRQHIVEKFHELREFLHVASVKKEKERATACQFFTKSSQVEVSSSYECFQERARNTLNFFTRCVTFVTGTSSIIENVSLLRRILRKFSVIELSAYDVHNFIYKNQIF